MKVLNDLLWSGNLKIYQDDENFMFSIDSILLSKFVTINPSIKKVLDIGTGTAPIPIILASRNNVAITGVEIQENSYLLALENVKLNNLESKIDIIYGDIKKIDLKNNCYDIITCNPPYYKDDMLISNNKSKSIARSELTISLDDIFKISKQVLKDKGRVAIVNRPERLIDIIMSMKKYGIEPKKIQFVYPKIGKPANHVLIEGMKNGRSELKILKPLIVHNDDNSYSEEIIKIFN